MAVKTWIVSVAFVVEYAQDGEDGSDNVTATESALTAAAVDGVAAWAAGRPDLDVVWQGGSSMPLDDVEGIGRCAECNVWVCDIENHPELMEAGLAPGAVVDDRLLCDEDLPEGHPVAYEED